MEPKKNSKADLNKRSVLFFQLGLILILLITWQAIEYKTYERDDIDTGQVNLDLLEEEDVPITENLNTPPPPPPPPPAPEVIEVIEDEVEEEEDIIESTETTQEEIIEVREVQVAETVEKIEDVPFTVIEDAPVFPGCEKFSSKAERKNCMSERIKEFVDKKFNRDLGGELGLSGINRIYVTFMIDEKGKIINVRSRGPHPRLEEEAKRVVGSLPSMTPGKQRGKAVRVQYSLPIVFQVQD